MMKKYNSRKYLIIIFFQNQPPQSRHIKYRRINFTTINVVILTTSLLQAIWSYFQEGLNLRLRLRVNNSKYRALIVLNWSYWQPLHLHSFTKIDHR